MAAGREVAGDEVLLGGVRARLLAALRGRGECGARVSDLVEECGLHRNTVCRHLDALVAAGLVERFAASGGRRGRPTGFYRAVACGRPDSGFAWLAGVLASRLNGELDGRERARELGAVWGARVAERGVSAVRQLRRLGFEPEVSEDGRTLHLHACPLLSDGGEDPGVCTMHVAMVRALLESEGTEAARLVVRPLSGDGSCCLHLGDGARFRS